jgi:DNA primase
MTRTVYLENWHTWVEPTIDDILLAAGQAGANTPEQIALLAERNILAEMIQEVKNVGPEQRQSLDSPLIACSVRESLDIPNSIIERVGEIHDIYRRFRNRLEWPTKGKEID